MEINVTIPNHLSEITLRQYKKYLVVGEENDDVNFIQAKMMEIFCGVSHIVATQMKYSDVEDITGTINEMFLAKPKLVTTFKMNDKEYGFIPNLDDMTLGEYIDLDSFTGEYKNIEVAMNVLYRPIKAKVGSKYVIKDYNPKTKDEMLDMPMDAVISSLFFFLNLGLELSEITLNSLKITPPIQLEELKHFQQNMDGINRFMPYLRETLSELKISLN
jgi:hypothetical protein|tara:strand:+ start:624 stop:1274 length:651 start_codon:yes stop_codon:yes gene_type:complete